MGRCSGRPANAHFGGQTSTLQYLKRTFIGYIITLNISENV
jgi:hypothetical protein